jgi:hypothetical protein
MLGARSSRPTRLNRAVKSDAQTCGKTGENQLVTTTKDACVVGASRRARRHGIGTDADAWRCSTSTAVR